ncbi:hypothetical protein BO443_100237 [Burkholderia orbicola]
MVLREGPWVSLADPFLPLTGSPVNGCNMVYFGHPKQTGGTGPYLQLFTLATCISRATFACRRVFSLSI